MLGLSDVQHGHIGHVSLRNRAIATSSPKASQMNGKDHILSPTGTPALWSSVSIEADHATTADALSTAAVFMSEPRLAKLKADFALARILAISPDGNLRSL